MGRNVYPLLCEMELSSELFFGSGLVVPSISTFGAFELIEILYNDTFPTTDTSSYLLNPLNLFKLRHLFLWHIKTGTGGPYINLALGFFTNGATLPLSGSDSYRNKEEEEDDIEGEDYAKNESYPVRNPYLLYKKIGKDRRSN